MDREIEKSLVEASELLAREAGAPEDVWHRDFGWVLRNGKPTEMTGKFYEWLLEKDLVKRDGNE